MNKKRDSKPEKTKLLAQQIQEFFANMQIEDNGWESDIEAFAKTTRARHGVDVGGGVLPGASLLGRHDRFVERGASAPGRRPLRSHHRAAARAARRECESTRGQLPAWKSSGADQ